jgi:2'-5' RNA ligase
MAPEVQRSRPMARLFVAVWPAVHVADQLAAVVPADQHGVRWAPRASWHVTLRFLGDADPDEVRRCLEGAELPPATAVFGPAARRLGRALVVPVAGLDELAAAVARATAGVQQWLDDRPFQGHLTLGRLRAGVRGPHVRAPIHAEMDVTEIALVHSELRGTGPVYHVIGRWSTG